MNRMSCNNDKQKQASLQPLLLLQACSARVSVIRRTQSRQHVAMGFAKPSALCPPGASRPPRRLSREAVGLEATGEPKEEAQKLRSN